MHKRLTALDELGLGYLTLGEATPALSGGEAQRLKLVSQMHRDQTDAVFVLDEPSVGLHPLDVRTLLDVLQRLADRGATVIVIEHDLDLIANADHMIDLGPGGGEEGGRIIATGPRTRSPATPRPSPGTTSPSTCAAEISHLRALADRAAVSRVFGFDDIPGKKTVLVPRPLPRERGRL